MNQEFRPRLNFEEYQIILKRRGITKEYEETLHPKIPKYLLIDVETLPAAALVFTLFSKAPIQHDHLLNDVTICCWSAKWLYSTEMMSDCMTSEEAVKKDDKRIMESLWGILNDAECIIGHNCDRFDMKMINARFVYNKIKPPTPYQTIDTLKHTQKALGTMSHRLDYFGKFMFNKGKLHTDFSLWRKCYDGDQESLDYMLKYNRVDVELLEELYLEALPYMRPHPNFALYAEATETCCIYCGHTELEDAGMYVTSANRYHAHRCKKCGGIMRDRLSDVTRQERNNMLISIAR